MIKSEKRHMFMDMIRDKLSYIPNIISAAIFSPIKEGTEMVMQTIEKRIKQIEKRIWRNTYSLLIIGLGEIFLVFALFFFLIEYFSWTRSASFFFIGIIIFVTGLFLRLSLQSNR